MHEIISEAAYRKLIGKTAGHAYLLYGEEDYLKAHAVRLTRESICPDPAFAIFNDITVDAIDYTPDALANAMSAPPMMADERLILLRGLDFTAMRAEELDTLLETLSLLEEYPFNTLLIHVAADMIDEGYSAKAPSPTLKKLAEVVIPVHFEAPTDSKLNAWAGKHFAHLGVSADTGTCAFLISFVGRNMFLLSAEIEKLAYYVKQNGRDAVNEADVRLVCVPQLSADAFALSNAILSGKYSEALEALAVMKFQRIEPLFVQGELSRTLCDMQAVKMLLDAGRTTADVGAILKIKSSYKVGLYCRAVSRIPISRLSRAVELCAAADAEIKSSYGDYTPIEKLICSL